VSGALVSVLIVTYEHAGEIDACLDGALAQAGDGLAVEVVVADNSSGDDTAERVRARSGEGVRLLEMGSNRGFAAAVNAAFTASTGEHVLILNPDCVMERGCARALREHLDARPDVALAAALLHDPDGTPQLHARRDAGLGGALWAFTVVGRRLDARVRDGRALAARRYEDLWADGPPREPVAVFCPAAACVMAARRGSTSASRCSSTTATSARGCRRRGAPSRSSRRPAPRTATARASSARRARTRRACAPSGWRRCAAMPAGTGARPSAPRCRRCCSPTPSPPAC
jgi:hypothetical protein